MRAERLERSRLAEPALPVAASRPRVEIRVSLFGGKYAMTVNSYEECWGFVKGVEAVLDHATHIPKLRQTDAA